MEVRDVSGIWKNIRGFLGWGKSGGSPTELTDPNTGQQTNYPKIWQIYKINIMWIKLVK